MSAVSFDDAWGVDVAVSTPRLMTALVEEAVEVGDVGRLLTLQTGGATLSAYTVPHEHPIIATMVSQVPWPPDVTLVAILRDGVPGDEGLIACPCVEPSHRESSAPSVGCQSLESEAGGARHRGERGRGREREGESERERRGREGEGGRRERRERRKGERRKLLNSMV